MDTNKRLNACGINLSKTGIGTWELAGDVWGQKDDSISIRAILTGLEAGSRFIDTAAGYGSGHAEKLVKLALAQWPDKDDVIVSTKILPKDFAFAPSPNIPMNDVYPEDWIREQVDLSLARLGKETIDILFFHTWSRAWAHEDSWIRVLEDLKADGKIRAVGISIPDEGIADANVAISLGIVDVIQCVFNIFQQEPMYTLFPLAKKYGVGIVARSPFSSGALTGSWSKDMAFEDGDWRGNWPQQFKENWLSEQCEMSEIAKSALSKYDGSIHEAAIQFILSNPDVCSVIPGSSNPKHVHMNMSASSAPTLSQAQIVQLKDLWVEGKLHGTYNGSK